MASSYDRNSLDWIWQKTSSQKGFCQPLAQAAEDSGGVTTPESIYKMCRCRNIVDWAVLGKQLNSVILEVFFNCNNSMIWFIMQTL